MKLFALSLLALMATSAHAAQLDSASADEAYRKSRAENAATLEEFMDWATPAEIQADFGFEDLAEAPLVEQAAGGVYDLEVRIHLNSRRITVSSPEGTFSAGALGGRPGHSTPRGCFRAIGLERMHWSRKYKAPMPNSVFFYPGVATHTGSLSVMSHGCVHLGADTSARLYALAARYRSSNRICVSRD